MAGVDFVVVGRSVGAVGLCGLGIVSDELPVSVRAGCIGLRLWSVHPVSYQQASYLDAQNNVGG